MDTFDLLRGELILNTRPAHQQQELNSRLQSLGATVCSIPAIEIQPAASTAFLDALSSNLEPYDILLFVSRNAVSGFLSFLGSDEISGSLKIGVIGEGTLRAVNASKKLCHLPVIEAYPYNSEGLLDSTQLQSVYERNILICRGQTGRNLLGDELLRRGARISYCEVYQRAAPANIASQLEEITAEGFPDLAVFTSNEGLANFIKSLQGPALDRMLQIPWVLISERMRESAIDLGHNAEIIIAELASDAGIELAICEWQGRRYSRS